MLDDLQGLLEETRELLEEDEEDLWSDRFLIRQLNKGANLMCRGAGVLRYPYQEVTIANQSEYPLKISPLDIFSVTYFDGNLPYPLEKLQDLSGVQTGKVQTSNLVRQYYIKPYVSYLMNQNATTSAQELTKINAEDEQDYRTVLGLLPAPDTAGRTITIECMLSHPRMRNPGDKCLVPEDFRDGVVAYAIAKASEKERFMGEAKYWYEVFNDMSTKLHQYMAQAGEVGHLKMRPRKESQWEGYPIDGGHRIVLD
jgi:hypothetical protein